jgi:hypothetical protein
MANQEVGRWTCGKCGKVIVAAGVRSPRFKGSGAFAGHCPWDCGAWVNRSFRLIRSGDVQVYRAEEWDQQALDAQSAASGWTA